MKPAYLLKKMREMRKGQKEHKDDEVHAELEHEVYSQVLFCFCFLCIFLIFCIAYHILQYYLRNISFTF